MFILHPINAQELHLGWSLRQATVSPECGRINPTLATKSAVRPSNSFLDNPRPCILHNLFHFLNILRHHIFTNPWRYALFLKTSVWIKRCFCLTETNRKLLLNYFRSSVHFGYKTLTLTIPRMCIFAIISAV